MFRIAHVGLTAIQGLTWQAFKTCTTPVVLSGSDELSSPDRWLQSQNAGSRGPRDLPRRKKASSHQGRIKGLSGRAFICIPVM